MCGRGNARLAWHVLCVALQIHSILKADTCARVSMLFRSTGQTSTFHKFVEHTLPCAQCKYINANLADRTHAYTDIRAAHLRLAETAFMTR